MGSERVDAHFQTTNNEVGAEVRETAPLSYKKIFDNCCPFYMAIGMSREEFWNGEPSAVRDYRRAWKLKQKEQNYEWWMQGMYFYEALIDASPMFRFSTTPVKPLPYSDEPYPLTKEDKNEQQERKEKLEMEKMRAYMTT